MTYSKEQRMQAQDEFYRNKMKSGRPFYLDDNILDQMNIKKLVPKAGSVFIAVLPRPEDPLFFLDTYVHYDVGPDNGSFLCLNKMANQPCPVCEYKVFLKDSGEAEEVYSEYNWSRRILLWVVDVASPRTIGDGVYIYDAPKKVIEEIRGLSTDARSGALLFDISDPTENQNLVFNRDGKGLGTRYSSFKLETRRDTIPPEYYDLPPIQDVLVWPNAEYLRDILGFNRGGAPNDAGSSPVNYDDQEKEQPAERMPWEGDRENFKPPYESQREPAPQNEEHEPARDGRAPQREPEKQEERNAPARRYQPPGSAEPERDNRNEENSAPARGPAPIRRR
jgi:hypothetical protein